eukprot:TRINITY_DN1960_c0_g2_i1.p1 TRINITY_DN1960_c0_g2~~TRINITY_DN1960_c0_g2_i1.p1  ORF type:complete len:839 (+),score=152.55 TRINITY_DN1960_c0_g2_i1:240-2519(+)
MSVSGLVLKRFPAALTTVCLVISTFGILVMDISNAAVVGNERPWVLVVICCDLSLTNNTPLWVQVFIVMFTLFYLLITAVESALRLGLYDMPGLVPERGFEATQCSKPPCAGGVNGISSFLLYAIVFVIDFLLTRGFARGQRQQHAMVVQSVKTAERVSHALTNFDLAQAAASLESAEDGLPPGLLASLRQLIENLASYRPYLPDGLLYGDSVSATPRHQNDHVSSIPSPVAEPGFGEENPNVAVVFTDIQSSTELWEHYPVAMFDSLQLHNSRMRSLADARRGYEVKTIGDAFMLAFADVVCAFRFALDIQVALVHVDWPAELDQHELCRRCTNERGDVIWHGPRVRIGMHCGDVRIERNPITWRCDYFGPPVNTAARVESTLVHGGLTGVTQPVLEAVEEAGAVPPFMAIDWGLKELKGIRDRQRIHIVVPNVLAGREAVLDGSTTDSCSTSVTGSVCDFSLDPNRTPILQNLLLGLRSRPITCASERTRMPETPNGLSKELQELLVVIESAADMTQGAVNTVLSNTCVVSWNSTRLCQNHDQQCSYFLRRVHADDTHGRLHGGVASGNSLTGNLAAARKRHSTIIGSCVERSWMLAESALICDEAALLHGSVAEHCRCVTHWAHALQMGERLSSVFAFVPQCQQDDWKWGFTLEDVQCAALDMDADAAFLSAVVSGDWEALASSGNVALRTAAERGARGLVRVLVGVPDTTPEWLPKLGRGSAHSSGCHMSTEQIPLQAISPLVRPQVPPHSVGGS